VVTNLGKTLSTLILRVKPWSWINCNRRQCT